MNDEREKILESLARWVVNKTRHDRQWGRDFLDRWEKRHGTADDLRERCRREWEARADAVPGVRREA